MVGVISELAVSFGLQLSVLCWCVICWIEGSFDVPLAYQRNDRLLNLHQALAEFNIHQLVEPYDAFDPSIAAGEKDMEGKGEAQSKYNKKCGICVYDLRQGLKLVRCYLLIVVQALSIDWLKKIPIAV